MTIRKSEKILIGMDSIIEYIQVSRPTFEYLITIGLPVVQINKRWYAHTDGLDNFFLEFTHKFRFKKTA